MTEAQHHLQLTDAEREAHIEGLDLRWQAAYARHQAYELPADRDEALMWLHMRDKAILERSKAVRAARHAEFEQRITEGVDFFQSAYAQALGKGAVHA